MTFTQTVFKELICRIIPLNNIELKNITRIFKDKPIKISNLTADLIKSSDLILLIKKDFLIEFRIISKLEHKL